MSSRLAATIRAPTLKPWSVAIFDALRPDMTKFVSSSILPLLEDLDHRRIVVGAPVKSGKREIVEYIAMRDLVAPPMRPKRVHVFISAFHRKADEDQRVELTKHNLAVFSISGNTAARSAMECLMWIESKVADGLLVVLHFDECDYGSGSEQSVSDLWREIRNNPKVSCILYSATPEEVLYSGEVEHEGLAEMREEILDGHHVRYDPPPTYCGPARFLDADLVHVATPFFDKAALTLQGKQIIADFKEAIQADKRRNIIVLRLSYSVGGNKKENKAIHQFASSWRSFPELAGFDVVFDTEDKETVEWSNPDYWRRKMPTEVPTIIVVDQKSSRSTEWRCHDRVFAVHDFRNRVARFSTISQAVERVNHYEDPEKGIHFQPIRIYCHKKTLLLSAGKITYDEYMTAAWEPKKITGTSLFTIRNVITKQLHPDYPHPLDPASRDLALQKLECFARLELADRVKGSIKQVPVYDVVFHPTDEARWSNTAQVAYARAITRSVAQNPFPLSREKGLEGLRFKGYFQGNWTVLDYDTQVKEQQNWGARTKGADGIYNSQRVICYQNGELGVAVRIDTGARKQESTLKAFKSMYGTR